jgi:hypothetical protein
MTKTELNAFRRALENRQTELGNGNRNREALAIETSPDELDRIQCASDREWAMHNLDRHSNWLREVRTHYAASMQVGLESASAVMKTPSLMKLR